MRNAVYSYAARWYTAYEKITSYGMVCVKIAHILRYAACHLQSMTRTSSDNNPQFRSRSRRPDGEGRGRTAEDGRPSAIHGTRKLFPLVSNETLSYFGISLEDAGFDFSDVVVR